MHNCRLINLLLTFGGPPNGNGNALKIDLRRLFTLINL